MLYLLSTQVLLDILGKQSPGTQWMTTAPAGSVEISVVSIGQAQRYIGKLSSASEREKLMRALRPPSLARTASMRAWCHSKARPRASGPS